MRIINERLQRTIAVPVEVAGTGFITGQAVQLRFVPAAANSGISFVRTDLAPPARIQAHVRNVTGTQRRTTLGQGAQSVTLVEHVLAALNGLHIDNCTIELNAPEPPGLDGSAHAFMNLLRRAGIVTQPARKAIWAPTQVITIEGQDATLSLHPPEERGLRASYLLDYGERSPIVWQIFTTDVTPEAFVQDIAPCRTFLTEEEAHALRQQGLGSRTKVNDLVIFGRRGPIENKLRFGNEPARHKILDLIGDMSLLGEDVYGHLVAYRSGHPLNVELVRELHRRLQQQCLPQRAVA